MGALAILAAAGSIVLSGGRYAPGTRTFGTDRLVAWKSLPEMSGPWCEILPARATQNLMAALQQGAGSGAADARPTGQAPPFPSEAVREAVAKRPPIATLKDTNAGFAGIAVDPIRNEVVMADENMFSIHVYDRLENTPPTAKMSEPKRMISGENTYLEFACGVYVDPATGEIYAINNDTLNWMPVFSRDAKGDAHPVRKLATPHTTFGIVADEQEQVLFMTIQDDQAVVVFKKDAKDEDPAVRTIQGPSTKMADPHGIALDTKRGELWVSNWGTANSRVMDDPQRARRNLPVGRNRNIPSSGRIEPPSLTVYPKGAKGDVAPLRMIVGPKAKLDWPTSLAVHSGRGELFVANDTGNNILVFDVMANGDVAPKRIIEGPKTLIKNPTGVAVDEKNNELWVANFGNHSATVYDIDANGNIEPKRIIRSTTLDVPAPMIGNPHTMAFDTKRNEILVANCVAHPQVVAFERTANGVPRPTRSIAGQNTLIARTIHDMAYDPIHDEIVVPQFFAFAILTFDGGANGNVPPKRKIFGPSTGIRNPDAVSLDPVNGEIYVPQDNNKLLVFKREVNGDAAPIRILDTGDGDPNRVVIDPVHNLLIVSGGPRLRIWDRTASGKVPPKAVIRIPQGPYNPPRASGTQGGGGSTQTALMAVNPDRGLVFVNVRVGGRFRLEDYVGVWSVFDNGEVPPRYTIGGPNHLLKDVRGIALDPVSKVVYISDKTHNAIFGFSVPETF
ncbi:MAG TPA: beta-propeller fold lactonase family protein [Terriglobia bacterium]|nr:beta-propeller fold lactonase family protein [Terriglobia bacterium]